MCWLHAKFTVQLLLTATQMLTYQIIASQNVCITLMNKNTIQNRVYSIHLCTTTSVLLPYSAGEFSIDGRSVRLTARWTTLMHYMRTASADWRLFFTTKLRSWLNSYSLELKHTCILRGIYSAPPNWHALTRALCNAFCKWLLTLAWCCFCLACYKTRTLPELFNWSWKQTEHPLLLVSCPHPFRMGTRLPLLPKLSFNWAIRFWICVLKGHTVSYNCQFKP